MDSVNVNRWKMIGLVCRCVLNIGINISIILCLITIFLIIYKGGVDLYVSFFGIHLKASDIDRPISIALVLLILKSVIASKSTMNILGKKIDFAPLLVMLSAIIIYFVVMPLTHTPAIQTETLNRIGYFNIHSMKDKWDSGWGTGILKQTCNLDYGPRARYLHWLVEWIQAKIDARITYWFGFSLYYYMGVFTNLLNCFLVFLLIYKLFEKYSIACISASFFLMASQSLAVPFYRYTNKFKTITVFLFVSYIIISVVDKQEYLYLKEKYLAVIRKYLKRARNLFNLKNIWCFISESMRFLYLSIYQNSIIFYIFIFIAFLINSFLDEISYICIIPWLLLILFFRGIRSFVTCGIISSWVQLFYISFYYIIAPKIWYSYYTGTWWNQKEDLFSNVSPNIFNNLLFGLFNPSTYKLLFRQLGGILGYFNGFSFKEDFIIFIMIGILVLIAGVIFNNIKNHSFKEDKIFYRRLFFITTGCLLVWQINSAFLGGRVHNFPYNYPIVILSIPVGTIIGFCYVRIARDRLWGRLALLMSSIVIFMYNIKNADSYLEREFRQCNSKPFFDNVIKPVQDMDFFIRKCLDRRPFYISYPNLTETESGVTPAGYAERDMLFGFQAVIPAFFIYHFEKGNILSTVTPYEKFYAKKINYLGGNLFYDIFKKQMIDLNKLMDKSQNIGDISYFVPQINSALNGQLKLPEIDSRNNSPIIERMEFDMYLHKNNTGNKTKIGFFFRSILVNDLSVYTPFKIILFEEGEKTTEILIEHDYGYSFKLYEIPLTKNKCSNAKLIIEFEEIKTLSGNYRRHFILTCPFLFEDDIWQDV